MICCLSQVLTDLTNYAELYRGLQDAHLPLVADRSGLVYNPLMSVEVLFRLFILHAVHMHTCLLWQTDLAWCITP